MDAKPQQKDALTNRVLYAYNKLVELGKVRNKAAFAIASGFPQQYWKGFENGTRKVSSTVAVQISKQFGLSLQYLLTAEGNLFEQPENNLSESSNTNSNVTPKGLLVSQAFAYLRFVPVVARATFAEMGDSPDPEEYDTIAVPIQPHEDPARLEKCWVFEVNGDSMEPTVWHGQRIVAEPVNEGDWEYQSDRVYVVSYAGYLVVKRIKTNDLRQKHYLELWSDNEKKGGMKVAQRREIKGIWKVLRLDRAPDIY